MPEDVLELTTDSALIGSLTEHKVDELKLEPFSLMRQTIAIDLCDRNAGVFWNAVMTVWVCTLKDFDALDAHASPKKAKVEAFKWAESRGYNHHNWRPVVDIYNRLMDEWDKSVSNVRVMQPNGSKPEELPNDGGQPA